MDQKHFHGDRETGQKLQTLAERVCLLWVNEKLLALASLTRRHYNHIYSRALQHCDSMGSTYQSFSLITNILKRSHNKTCSELDKIFLMVTKIEMHAICLSMFRNSLKLKRSQPPFPLLVIGRGAACLSRRHWQDKDHKTPFNPVVLGYSSTSDSLHFQRQVLRQERFHHFVSEKAFFFISVLDA